MALGRSRSGAPVGALPNLVIVGAQKCGTTALHSYLARHPEVFMSSPKELNFFIDDRREGKWRKGLDWYRAHFDPAPEFLVRGESSPNYSVDPILAGVPERMAGVIPDAKLIFMVRDPIVRVRAGYIHHYANRRESRPFAEAVLDTESSYVMRSRYHHQLSRWLEHYPQERLLVVGQEELKRNRRRTLKRVWRFLEVRENVWRESFRIKRLETGELRRKTRLGRIVSDHVSAARWKEIQGNRFLTERLRKPKLTPEIRAGLEEILREDIARFRELTDRSWAEWSI